MLGHADGWGFRVSGFDPADQKVTSFFRLLLRITFLSKKGLELTFSTIKYKLDIS